MIREESADPSASAGVAVTTTAYGGLSTTVTNSKGQTRTTAKDAQGRVVRAHDAALIQTSYTYDALGQLTQTNAAGSITSMTYNQTGPEGHHG